MDPTCTVDKDFPDEGGYNHGGHVHMAMIGECFNNTIWAEVAEMVHEQKADGTLF